MCVCVCVWLCVCVCGVLLLLCVVVLCLFIMDFKINVIHPGDITMPPLLMATSTYISWIWGRLQTPVLLVVIGIFSAITSFVISFSSNLSEVLKWNLSQSEGGYLIWIIYATWCVLLAALSLHVTLTFCPQATGGGNSHSSK